MNFRHQHPGQIVTAHVAAMSRGFSGPEYNVNESFSIEASPKFLLLNM
jgi:hypothetical protein